jgi:hypothetical protein
MMSWKEGDPAPTPEQLAAYADGELDGRPALEPLRRRIAAWLAEHPDTAAEIEAQRRLTRLWRATTPPEPSEEVWDGVLERLEQLPRTSPEHGWRVARLAGWAGAALAACAAAVWLALALSGPGPGRAVVRQAPRDPGKRERVVAPRPAPKEDEPFPVATADEVEILRINGADTETVLVGELPVSGPLIMPEPGEVEITRPQPEVRMADGPPMVWPGGDKANVEP